MPDRTLPLRSSCVARMPVSMTATTTPVPSVVAQVASNDKRSRAHWLLRYGSLTNAWTVPMGSTAMTSGSVAVAALKEPEFDSVTVKVRTMRPPLSSRSTTTIVVSSPDAAPAATADGSRTARRATAVAATRCCRARTRPPTDIQTPEDDGHRDPTTSRCSFGCRGRRLEASRCGSFRCGRAPRTPFRVGRCRRRPRCDDLSRPRTS